MAKQYCSEEIIFQKRFQNARKILDLVVYEKPKCNFTRPMKTTKFVRKCLIAETLKSLEKDIPNSSHTNMVNHNTINLVTRLVSSSQTRSHDKENDMKATHSPTWRALIQQNDHVKESVKFGKKKKPKLTVRHNDSPAAFIGNKKYSVSGRSGKGKLPESKIDCRPKVDLYTDFNEKDYTPSTSYYDPPFRNEANQTKIKGNGPKVEVGFDIDIEKKNASDETHSPFGESALQLLRRLHDRLQSQGDNEGSDMVSAIEAFISGSGNHPRHRIEQSSLLYPEVFSHENVHVEADRKELEMELKKKEKKIEEQELAIDKLKELSEKLLNYYGQRRGGLDSPNNHADRSYDDVNARSENLNLKKKVKSQLELIINLELKVTSLQQKLKMYQKEDPPNNGNIANKASETDSAFEEKCASGSASTNETPTLPHSRSRDTISPPVPYSRSRDNISPPVPHSRSRDTISERDEVEGGLLRERNSSQPPVYIGPFCASFFDDELHVDKSISLSFVSDPSDSKEVSLHLTNSDNSAKLPDFSDSDVPIPSLSVARNFNQCLESTGITNDHSVVVSGKSPNLVNGMGLNSDTDGSNTRFLFNFDSFHQTLN